MHVHTRYFALIAGIILVALGVLAFIPQLNWVTMTVPDLNVLTSYGEFLGYFPMNVFNKILMIAIGAIGIGVSRMENVEPSVKFSRITAILMAVLAVLGLFEATNTLYGYMPLFGGEILLHAVFAIGGAYYGYVVPARVRSHVVKKTTLGKTAHV